MLAEFLNGLRQLVSHAETPKVVNYGDPRSVLVSANGELKPQAVPPQLRAHEVSHLDDFIAASNRWGASGVVFHCPSLITLVVDDNDRRDVVAMPLTESDCFRFLRSIGKSGIDHKAFVNHLKTILFEKVPDGLLPIVRRLEASTASRVTSELQQGRERGTREFQNELVGASELPEMLEVVTSVYSNAGLRIAQRVRCTLDVELPALTFRLAPLPDELTMAIEQAQATIHGILVDGLNDGIEVFHGTP